MKDWFQVEMLDDTTYVISEHTHYERKLLSAARKAEGFADCQWSGSRGYPQNNRPDACIPGT